MGTTTFSAASATVALDSANSMMAPALPNALRCSLTASSDIRKG